MSAIVGFTRAYEEASERLGFCALACLEQGGGSTPGPSSLADADYECEHGRLAGDVCPSPVVKYLDGSTVQSWPNDHPCGCWPSEQITVERIPAPIVVRHTAPVPDLMTTFHDAEEAVMTTETPLAPKRNGPSPEARAKSIAVRQAKAAERQRLAAEQLAAPPAPEPEPEPPAAGFSEATLAEELDAEIVRLAPLVERHARLVAARERLAVAA